MLILGVEIPWGDIDKTGYMNFVGKGFVHFDFVGNIIDQHAMGPGLIS